MAITDLAELISSMSARLDPEPYVWITGDVAPAGCTPVVTVEEAEGTTWVVPEPQARAAGAAHDFRSARITLEVHSSLEAVGLTAAFARALADVGISANVVAGFHHDHIFVPWDRRDDALRALEALQASG
ncbi:ACT domain-containing protein [Demequina lignilytica]|uniref:ACT domain-containing protein n=1 Tax=Demequina lignilytica TaxID=3051663 RepID=A0AB35MJC0_9MICO|nr:ACT domain-containing protein [Demequina sp. SYSU T0a273]MDN4483894.1 ACT domain-containing protein [Demequina sp. SYSU T0a273]